MVTGSISVNVETFNLLLGLLESLKVRLLPVEVVTIHAEHAGIDGGKGPATGVLRGDHHSVDGPHKTGAC